ncbi:phosphoribosylpyrophosphate synthetase [Jiulongibacter sediminis]|jgi:hypothetical protein|uniref:phosphoribosylpyrophosphate synthetase n=1 Tax=Jiulongibacter sediminis TaxID=1605367 RepID=UPI0026F257BE|nr:phosphoribosylpyrophosphate synthetase [Jiulongibacter sediminis]
MTNIKEAYPTLSIALNDLYKRGYTTDFNLYQKSHSTTAFRELENNEFEIVEHHRFDGMTNVADESVLYVIETNSGIKGTLIDAYGVDASPELVQIIRKMNFARQ